MIKATETKLRGCFIIEPTIYEDERGYFFESYNHKDFCEAIGREVNFVQDNQSFSTKGVIRALHYQTGDYSQAKLVRVLHGTVLDVAVDLKKDSATFGHHISIELSQENKKQLFIPKGFAHGFITLSQTAEFFYKCDNYYKKDAEAGIIYNDTELGINWKFPNNEMILSSKDLELPLFKNAKF